MKAVPAIPLPEKEFLLAIDAGVKTGLALYQKPDTLIWYRSHNMGSVSSLRKAAYSLLHSLENLKVIIVEGGGPVALAWTKEAQKLQIRAVLTDAGDWRKEVLLPREQRNGIIAKQTAIRLAESLIHQSEADSKNTPTHDAAEAILIGLWGCKEAGWTSVIRKIPR
ncbi:MAG: hypothetical protein H6541_10185 [Lentimicrobiaceae bacterium]|nr:hypothetical protein [Lentimicrobiaceae bacterium]HPG32561.1 hypothetical protein [Lentimicrobium sp.]